MLQGSTPVGDLPAGVANSTTRHYQARLGPVQQHFALRSPARLERLEDSQTGFEKVPNSDQWHAARHLTPEKAQIAEDVSTEFLFGRRRFDALRWAVQP